jgi:integrase
MIKAISKEQLRATLEVAKRESERDYLMILVASLHGLRASEVVNLTAGSIQDGYITVQRLKGSKRTTQPLLTSEEPLFDERTALLNYVRGMSIQQKIFSVARSTFWRVFQKHGKAAGVPAHLAHPHAAKHFCGKSLGKLLPINEVQGWMGHVNVGSTGIYMEPDEAEVNASVASCGALT